MRGVERKNNNTNGYCFCIVCLHPTFPFFRFNLYFVVVSVVAATCIVDFHVNSKTKKHLYTICITFCFYFLLTTTFSSSASSTASL